MNRTAFLIVFIGISIFLPFGSMSGAITPNYYKKGTDSERIEEAIADAIKKGDNSIEIPRMNEIANKAIWLIDRAIVLPSDFTLILRDCLIRLAPGTKDNIITNSATRSRVLGYNRNIRIIGIGNAMISGGLESHWEKPGDKNGFKTIGIFLCNIENFTIEGFKIEESQTWGISMNACSNGRIANIEFYNTNKYPNQDGIDIRKGCHDIIIENITGITGDDTIAITGLMIDEAILKASGMELDDKAKTQNNDIYNIIVNNIKSKVAGGHHIVRLLNQDSIKLYNIFISNVMDMSQPGEIRCQAAIKIGDMRYSTVSLNRLGETSRIFVDNVLSRAVSVVKIQGTLKDAVIKNIAGYDNNTNLIEKGSAPVENIITDVHQF